MDKEARALRTVKEKELLQRSVDSFKAKMEERGIKIEKRVVDYVREVVDKKARIVLSSGGLEPVSRARLSCQPPWSSSEALCSISLAWSPDSRPGARP